MTGPKRVRLSRAKGARKPLGAVNVARPSRWGNPFRIDPHVAAVVEPSGFVRGCVPGEQRGVAVRLFRSRVLHDELSYVEYPSIDEIRRQLAGLDLACWCPLDEPCHADVLLEIANREEVIPDG